VVDFFNEVEEELRADRVRTLTRKYLPWAIAALLAVLLLVGGVLGMDAWRKQTAAKASLAYQHGLEALQKDDSKAAETAFTDASKAGSRAYKTLALIQLGGIRLADNKPADAAKLFDDAVKAAPSPLLGDLAALDAAFALMDTASYADIEKRLQPLLKEGRPYRIQAREALAMAKLQAGKGKDARADFAFLTIAPDVPQDVRNRAQVAVQMIDSGRADKLAAVAKAAASLPAPVQAPAGFNPFAPQAGSPAPQAGAAPQ
jgi:hypothetical protein